MNATVENPYNQAFASGQYAWVTGLRGKYDNVRQYWEEEVGRHYIAEAVTPLVRRHRDSKTPVRVLDLGCGGGDGFETISGMCRAQPPISLYDTRLIRDTDGIEYHGIDINETLLKQARERMENRAGGVFTLADLSAGLPSIDERPCSIYFSSFGTFSHLTTEQTVRLLADIAVHSEPGAIVVGDWLGRYSYEWQNCWEYSEKQEQWLEYRISYIYPPRERASVEIDSMPLRLVGREEIERMVSAASRESGVQIRIERIFDRSLAIGRHIETGEYNDTPQGIREAVNSLLQPGRRTDFDTVRMHYRPREGFDRENEFFTALSAQWNQILLFLGQILDNIDRGNGVRVTDAEKLQQCSPAVRAALVALVNTIDGILGGASGDIRADIIEPQLALRLRQLEMDLQRGAGNGHGIVAVCTVDKK
jgi:SAM-dependent methyltransferase